MAFSAVYLQHHYVLDVVAGALYGVVAWGIVAMVSKGRGAECPTS
jgi:membrane-associated phospholipid phosphatase